MGWKILTGFSFPAYLINDPYIQVVKELITKQKMDQLSPLQIPNYSTKILWIDPNPNITRQLVFFNLQYGSRFHHFNYAKQAVSLITENKQAKIIVVCSSWNIEECCGVFKGLGNVYEKVIVFCESMLRASEVMGGYAGVVENVCWDTRIVIDVISALENKLLLIHNSRSQKVQVNNRVNLSAKFQQPQSQPQTSNPKKAPKKTPPNLKLLWVYSNPEDLPLIKSIYSPALDQAGFPIDFLESVDHAKFVEDDHPNCQFILIVRSGVEVEDVRNQVNGLRATIFVDQGEEEGQGGKVFQGQNQSRVGNVEELIRCLECHAAENSH